MSVTPTDRLIAKLWDEERKNGMDPIEAEYIVAKRLSISTQRVYQGVRRVYDMEEIER